MAFPLLALRMTMSRLDLRFLRERNYNLERLGLGGFACLNIFEQSCWISLASDYINGNFHQIPIKRGNSSQL